MKEKQRQEIETLQNLQDNIEKNEKRIKELIEEEQNLKEFLKNFEGKPLGLSESTKIYEEKQSELETLKEKLSEVIKEKENLEKNSEDLDEIKAQSKALKQEIKAMISQKENLENLKNLHLTESKNNLAEDIELQKRMINDLNEIISTKESELIELEKNHIFKLKQKTAIYMANNFINFTRIAFQKFRFILSHSGHQKKVEEDIQSNNPIVVSANKCISDQTWPKEKLFSFIDDMMADKYKLDSLCLKENKFPKPLPEHLVSYMKSLYQDQNEASKNCSMLINCIVEESSNDNMCLIIKKMLQLSKESLPYHFVIFLTIAIHDFETLKNPFSGQAMLLDIFNKLETYIDEKQDIRIKLSSQLKPSTVSDEEYIFFLLGHKLNQINAEFTEICDSPDTFLEVAETELKV